MADVLFEMGALSVSATDLNAGKPNEQAIFAESPPYTQKEAGKVEEWKNASITALYPITTDVQSLIMIIATQFNLPNTPTFSIKADVFDEKTPDEWVRQVQASFQPIELQRIRVSFPWHSTRTDIIDIKLEPGIAFGTGEHATTQMCLSWLQRVVQPNHSMLDFGSGSGVLAIAACKLEEGVSAVGVDIDPVAVKAADENAVLNGVEKKVLFVENKDEPKGKLYDIVVANILARPLTEMAPLLVSRLKKGAFIAMSGLLVTQAPQLIEHYAQHGVSMHDAEVKSGWSLIVGVKR